MKKVANIVKTKREALLFFENGDMNVKSELFGLIC